MKIVVTSLFVQDQDKALEFYTQTLGFVKKHDIPAGKFRWIALVSPDELDGLSFYSNQMTILPPRSINRSCSPMAFRPRCLVLQILTKSTNAYWNTG